jgi:hypothetical protein
VDNYSTIFNESSKQKVRVPSVVFTSKSDLCIFLFPYDDSVTARISALSSLQSGKSTLLLKKRKLILFLNDKE